MTSVAILVGGQARRWGGRDKSRVVVGDRTILARQLEAARYVTDDIFLVGNSQLTEAAGLDVIDDCRPGCGPLAGLEAALARAKGDVLLMACDLPFVTGPMLALLVSCRADDVDAVVPRTDRSHPLCAVYAQTCAAVTARHLAAGRHRMLDLLGEIRVRTVLPAELSRCGQPDLLLTNLNSQTDLDALASMSH